ncbi:MAG: PIG-L family deacetylase [Ignavibacteria bacterium]|nr:PIG-L family deacetylase [Ignavibacteria bacterium]
MKTLYIFPHPDDESFGPASAMSAQQRAGHEINLLTLTKGGATKQRHKLGLSIKQMGEERHKEMLEVEKVLGLKEMTLLDLPDSGLAEMDPREIENAVKNEIERMKPEILVTYPVHGISGFHDHLVTHAVVKRLFLRMKDKGTDYLKRLAFFTLSKRDVETNVMNSQNPFHILYSTENIIDCKQPVEEEDIRKMQEALRCYKTYESTIEQTGIMDFVSDEISFEFYQEDFDPHVKDIAEGIKT